MSITIGKLNTQVQELVERVRQLEQEVATLKSEQAASFGGSSGSGGSGGSSSSSSGGSSGSGSGSGPLYVVVSQFMGSKPGDDLMAALQDLFPYRELRTSEIDYLPANAEDVFLNVRPFGPRTPIGNTVARDLERIFAATGVRASLIIGEAEGLEPRTMADKWFGIDYIDPRLYRAKAVYFRTMRQDNFLSWASDAKDLVNLTGAGAPSNTGGSSRLLTREQYLGSIAV